MKFSILIPLYNSQNYISECIDSALSQNFNDYEIVIVDDGSTDESGKIADEYQRKNADKIRVIHKENTGVLLTRRRAIMEAKGDYIVWLDSDDVLKAEALYNLQLEISVLEPDVIIYNFEKYEDEKEIIHTMKTPSRTIVKNKKGIYLQMIAGRDMNELWTKCIKREIVDIAEDYTPFKHVKMGDDLFCLFPIMDRAKKIEYVNESYYKYRNVQSSITHKNSYDSYYSYRTIYERAYWYMGKWYFSSNEYSKAQDVFAYRIVDCVVQCAAHGSLSEFIALIKRVRADEEKQTIFSNGRRTFNSRIYKSIYDLVFTTNSVRPVYCYIKVITFLSRIKHMWR